MRDWNASHQPDGVYCSPACGGSCTKKAYDKAIEDSESMARQLTEELGGRWAPRVWENLGWHFDCSLDLGDDRKLTVHPHRPEGARAWASIEAEGFRQHCGEGSPVEAVGKALDSLRQELSLIDRLLGAVEVAMGPVS